MKVQIINQWFRKFGQIRVRYRWWFIAFAAAATISGGTGLRFLQPRNARDSWFDDNETIGINTRKFEKQFGNNDNILVLVQSDDCTETFRGRMMLNGMNYGHNKMGIRCIDEPIGYTCYSPEEIARPMRKTEFGNIPPHTPGNTQQIGVEGRKKREKRRVRIQPNTGLRSKK